MISKLRKILCIVLFLAAIGGSFACSHKRSLMSLQAAGGGPLDVVIDPGKFSIRRDVLPNGLVVLYIHDPSAPFIVYSSWVKVGSAWEKPGATGIAHLFEHLMFKGTPRYSGKAFFQNLETQGAVVNAYTQRDMTVFYEMVAPHLLEKVIDMESDRLAHLIFSKEQLDGERQVVKEERRLRVDSDFASQQVEEMQQLAFPKHPYGWPVIGYEADLNQLSLEQCREFFKTYYQPGNIIVTIAGDFQYESTKVLIEKYYGVLPGHPVPELDVHSEAKQEGERRKVIQRPVMAESFIMGYRIPELTHNDLPTLTMLSWVLFDMHSSRAQKRLVREKQLALQVGAQVAWGRFPNLFYVTATARQGIPIEQLKAELDQIIEEIKLEPMSEEELTRVKNRLIYSVLNETKSPLGIASWVTFGEFYHHDHLKIFDLIKRYNELTPADLLRVARIYLRRDQRSIVFMRPRGKG